MSTWMLLGTIARPVDARPRMASPRSTGSILITSAPQSASSADAAGTKVCSATSSTRTPSITLVIGRPSSSGPSAPRARSGWWRRHCCTRARGYGPVVRFMTHMPGLMRYPPSQFPPGSDRWEARMTCADFQRVARAVDDLGFDALTVSEHLALPVDLEPNMGAWWPHAFTAMTFLAGATTRIRVNASVIVLPYHHPVAFAKAVSTLDVMSSGRVILTFGVGMAPAEFAALGVPVERRGRVTHGYVAAMETLWGNEQPEFHGEWVEFADVAFEPKPLQVPHPPLWFGGRSLASLDRAARLGSGWAPAGGLLGKGPWFEEPAQLPDLLARVRETRAELG